MNLPITEGGVHEKRLEDPGTTDVRLALDEVAYLVNHGSDAKTTLANCVNRRDLDDCLNAWRRGAQEGSHHEGIDTVHSEALGQSVIGVHWWRNPVTGRSEVLAEGFRLTPLWGYDTGAAITERRRVLRLYQRFRGFSAIYREQVMRAEQESRRTDVLMLCEDDRAVTSEILLQINSHDAARILAARGTESVYLRDDRVVYARRKMLFTAEVEWRIPADELLSRMRLLALTNRASFLRARGENAAAAQCELELLALNGAETEGGEHGRTVGTVGGVGGRTATARDAPLCLVSLKTE